MAGISVISVLCFPEGAVSLGAGTESEETERKERDGGAGQGQEAHLYGVDSPPESCKQAKVTV